MRVQGSGFRVRGSGCNAGRRSPRCPLPRPRTRRFVIWGRLFRTSHEVRFLERDCEAFCASFIDLKRTVSNFPRTLFCGARLFRTSHPPPAGNAVISRLSHPRTPYAHEAARVPEKVFSTVQILPREFRADVLSCSAAASEKPPSRPLTPPALSEVEGSPTLPVTQSPPPPSPHRALLQEEPGEEQCEQETGTGKTRHGSFLCLRDGDQRAF